MAHKARKTFRQALAERVTTHAAVLIEKARLFSRIAKAANTRAGRRLAYHCKSRCIKHLLTHCAGAVRVRQARGSADWGLMVVSVLGHGGLHTHSRWLDGSAA